MENLIEHIQFMLKSSHFRDMEMKEKYVYIWNDINPRIAYKSIDITTNILLKNTYRLDYTFENNSVLTSYLVFVNATMSPFELVWNDASKKVKVIVCKNGFERTATELNNENREKIINTVFSNSINEIQELMPKLYNMGFRNIEFKFHYDPWQFSKLTFSSTNGQYFIIKTLGIICLIKEDKNDKKLIPIDKNNVINQQTLLKFIEEVDIAVTLLNF